MPTRRLLFAAATLVAAACTRTAECPELTGPAPEIVDDAPGRITPEPSDEAAPIFDQAALRTFDIRISAANLAILDADPAAEQYVEGSLIFDGVEHGPVGVRYKGSIGAFFGCVEGSRPDDEVLDCDDGQCVVLEGVDRFQEALEISGRKVCPKLSFKIKFNHYDKGRRFFGLKKLQLHAMNLDPSLMRERLGYWLFRQMGVPAPRAVHARVLVNGEVAGLFANVEQIDGRFTRSRFADGKGNLYKEVWPATSEQQGELDAQDILQALKTNEDDNPSVDKFLAFGRAISSDSGDERANALATWLSVDNTVRFVAVDRTIRADDGPFHFYGPRYPFTNHNYYLYEEAMADRLWLIPWDLDNAFVVIRSEDYSGDHWLRITTEWDDQTVDCKPHTGDGIPFLPPSCDPLWSTLGCVYHPRYEAAVAELLAGPFSAATVTARLDAWTAQIASTVEEAHRTNPEQLEPTDWRAGLEGLRARLDTLRSQAQQSAGL